MPDTAQNAGFSGALEPAGLNRDSVLPGVPNRAPTELPPAQVRRSEPLESMEASALSLRPKLPVYKDLKLDGRRALGVGCAMVIGASPIGEVTIRRPLLAENRLLPTQKAALTLNLRY